MTENLCRFDMSRYATPKNEEEKRTLTLFGYRTLSLGEALEYAEVMKQLTVGGENIENLPKRLKEGSSELRYYKKGAKDIEGEEGNRIFEYIKEAERILPTALPEEGK